MENVIQHACPLDTIVAQCTARGNGAIGLIRISGPQAVSIVDQCARIVGKNILAHQASHTIHYGSFVMQDDTVDRVLFLLMKAPHTFTGEDTVEITCHNNQFIIDTIIATLCTYGARLAKAGEFIQYAITNNKMDLLQAEAINDLINAHSRTELTIALRQMGGSLSGFMHELEQDILRMRAFCDASFEFLDEEMTFDQELRVQWNALVEKIGALLHSAQEQHHIRNGIRITLVGSVNAGKSSLFNALLKKERAIVSPIAGTTRDVIEATVYKRGTYWTFVDTAGIRDTDNYIEAEGIARTYQEAQLADIILLVYDQSRAYSQQEYACYQKIIEQYAQKTILVVSKIDQPLLSSMQHCATVHISSVTCEGINELESRVQEKVDTLLAKGNVVFLLNQRHRELLKKMYEALRAIEPLLQSPIAYELVSYHLHDLLVATSDFTGKTLNQESFELIFRSFCVGK